MTESGVNLLVAAMDLKLVQMIRRAMNAGECGPCGPLGTTCQGVNHRLQPEPRLRQSQRIEPRPAFHPAPLFLPRPIIRPAPAIATENCVPVPVPVEVPRASRTVIEPPWRIRPWQNLPQIPPKVKLPPRQPDVVNTGLLLDLFI